MDFSADYIRARKTADDMTPPSPEAIEALTKPSFEIPPPGPANYGQPIDTTETSTITGKPKDKGLPAPPGETVPSHENPEESAWDTMVKGVRSLKGISKQSIGGALQAIGEPTYYGIEGVIPEEPIRGKIPALVEPGKALAAEGKKDIEATLPNVPAGSFKAHLYGAIQSVGLNVGALGLGLVTRNPQVPLLLMGALSAGQDYAENRSAGVSREDAYLGALANGAAEYFGEMLPIHAYLKEGAPLFRRAITGALLELPGELSTQVVQSTEEKLTRNPGMTWKDFMSTMKDTAIQTLMATTMTGGIFGAAGTLAGGVKNLGEKGSVGAERAAPAAPVVLDETTLKAEADRLGIVYRGMQPDLKGGQFPMFNDERPGSTGSGFVVMPGETVEDGLNRVRARFGLSPLLTPEKILSAFPGAAVAAEGGGFTIALPNGANIRILPDQSIRLDPATGVKVGEGEVLAGEIVVMDKTAIIRLAKEADETTLPHESFHAAMQMALSEEERTAVLSAYGGNEEAAADAYATWNPTFRNPLFQKIIDFFRKIREMILGPTAEGTFAKVRSGEAWQRSNEDPEAFFSRLADRVRSQMPEHATPEDVTAFMREEGVRPDEAILSGVIAKDGVVAKADVLSAIEDIKTEVGSGPDYQVKINTSAFRAWFGKSKVVDPAGKPVVVYHGTNSDIESFDTLPKTKRPGTMESSLLGTFFTVDEELARGYARWAGGDKVYPVYLKIENPKIYTPEQHERLSTTIENVKKLRAELERMGYDGILFMEQSGPTGEDLRPSEWVAFRPKQVKSIFNRGTWDLDDKRILYQIRRKTGSPPFVSQLRNVVADEKMFPPTLKSPSVVNTLMKYGVKADEIRDTGLAKFLADKPRITREQLLDYIDMNMVKVDEKVRTDDAEDLFEELSFTEPEPDEETGEYPEEPEWFAQGRSVSYTITQGVGTRFKLEIFERDYAIGPPVDKATGRTVAELIGFANQREREYARAEGNVKFKEWILPGAAKNYRELLITLPVPTKTAQHLVGEITVPDTSKAFYGRHWDEPNVLAHIRFDERTDAEGKPTMFIEEAQSDWHHEGRKEGYKTGKPDPAILKDAYAKAAASLSRNDNLGHDTVWEAFEGIQLTPNWRVAWSWDSQEDIDAVEGWLVARKASYKESAAVPDAPFKDTWYELTMKRAIRWAAEHGFDSISWTTGEQQIERYDLSKHVDSLSMKKRPSDDGFVLTGSKNSVSVLGKRFDSIDTLKNWIGSEVADRLEAAYLEAEANGLEYQGGSISGLDLKIGGQWARNLYDKMIPGWLNKYAKKWGVKVGETTVNTGEYAGFKYSGPMLSSKEFIERTRPTMDVLEKKYGNMMYGAWEGTAGWSDANLAGQIERIQRILPEEERRWGDSRAFKLVMEKNASPNLAAIIEGKLEDLTKNVPVHSLAIPPQMAADVLTKGQPLYQKKKSGRFPGEPNDKGYTFNSNDSEEVKNAGRVLLLNVWPDVEFTQSNEETAKRAQAMLDEGIVNIERLLARNQNQAFETPELSVAADRLRHGLNARLVDTGKQWLQGDGTVSDEEMKNAIALAAGLTQVVQGGISQTGRVQQSRQMAFEGYQPGTKQWTDAVSGTLESLRQLQGAEGMPLEAIVRKIMAVPEPSTFIPKLVKITKKDMFIEAWYGALLSNPVTHAANFIGNTVALFSSIPERGLASLAHRITGKGEGVAPGEAFAALYGAVAGFQDALRFAAKTAWTGESKFMGDRMERRVREPAITGANLGVSGPIGAAVDLLGMAIRGPGRALLSSDEFFKAVNFRMEVYAQAYREAYSESLTGDDLKTRMAEIVQNPPEIIQETAAEWANYQTFTNALGNLGSAVVKLSNAHPAMKVILPFVATPTNILKFTFERLGPLSLALKSVREEIASGGSRRDLAIARVSLGSMVIGTAAYLAAAGLITGGGPKDKDLLAAKRRKGWQAYSFKIGKKYHSFARMEPYATLFGMTADIVEMAGERSDFEIDSMAKAMVLSFAKNMTNKTYLTGVSDALEAITDPDKGGGRFVHRFVGSWIPAGVAQVERVMDPTLRDTYGPTSRGTPNALLRETKSMLREMRSRTPGLSSDLPPRLNLWGDPILLGGGYGPDIISPIYQSIEKESPADDEIIRNKVSISMPARFLYGTRPSNDIPMKDESSRAGIPLTPKEYDFLVRVAAGQKVVVDDVEYQVAEQTLKEDLEEMIASPEYKDATDGPDGAKALMIRAKVTAYRDAAKAMLLDASPELSDLFEEKIQERAEALIGVGQ